jgi:aspartyl-tRNA(Asn)/glutamyl-tRNA(Gln) amidotransferase subunit A
LLTESKASEKFVEKPKSLVTLRGEIESGATKASNLAASYYERIEKLNPTLNVYLSLTRERALQQAERVDSLAAKGEPLPPLAGIPVGIKDVLVMRGAPATAGSKILQGYEPPYDATVVSKLDKAGAVLLGKLNCDEFAMGSSNENSAFGPVRNPWDTERVPGGSSGGSAAAVASNMAVATLGTDTGGSIRQPASFCGVVGVLPTWGRVSRYGLIAFASSLDRVGPFAGNVRDAATMLGVIAGHDPMDATSSSAPVADYAAESDKPVDGMRIGIPKEYFGEGLDPEVGASIQAGIESLQQAGAEVKPISLPTTKYAIPTYYLVATAEASANLARFDGVRYGYRSPSSETLSAMYSHSRDEGFGAEVKRRIMLGTYALSAGYYDAYYGQALKVRTLTIEAFRRAYGEADLLIGATTPSVAFEFGSKTADPMAMYLSDVFTIPSNLSGEPAISVPFGTGEAGLPIGVQLLGPGRSEAQLFAGARVLEIADGRP